MNRPVTANPARRSGTRVQALDRGRKSVQNQSWRAAFDHLSAADREAPLDPVDLVELSKAAHLIGRQNASVDLLARAHQGFLSRGEIRPAARSAFWLGFISLVSGEPAQASGWLSRADRLLHDQPDCVEKGYLLLPVGYRSVHGGDAGVAYGAFVEAAAIGERFSDCDLLTLARQGQGRDTPIGRKIGPKIISRGAPLVRVKPKDLISAGIERVPRVVGVQNGQPSLEGGRTLEVQKVIWCTGYQPGFSWIDLPIFDEHGEPIHDRGVVSRAPGMYFVGLHFLYSMTSATLLGIGRDAEYVAHAIKSRTTASRSQPCAVPARLKLPGAALRNELVG